MELHPFWFCLKFFFQQSTQEEWQIVFYITCAVYTVGAILFCLMADGEIQDWARPFMGEAFELPDKIILSPSEAESQRQQISIANRGHWLFSVLYFVCYHLFLLWKYNYVIPSSFGGDGANIYTLSSVNENSLYVSSNLIYVLHSELPLFLFPSNLASFVCS